MGELGYKLARKGKHSIDVHVDVVIDIAIANQSKILVGYSEENVDVFYSTYLWCVFQFYGSFVSSVFFSICVIFTFYFMKNFQTKMCLMDIDITILTPKLLSN